MFIFLILDIAPSAGETTGILTAAALFFIATSVVAYLAFRLLKRTIRTAIRMAVVAALLIIALVGGISIYYFGGRSTPRPRPPVNRTR